MTFLELTQNLSPALSQRQYYLCLSVVVFLAVALQLFATTWGIAVVVSDSMEYLYAAIDIYNGNSFIHMKMTHWPPLFSIILGETAALLGVYPLSVARFFYTCIFAINSILMAEVVRVHLQSQSFAIIAAAIFVATPPILSFHTQLMTEALYISLSLSAIHMLCLYLNGRSQAFYLTSAILVALALLTRYAAAGLVLGCCLSLLIYGQGKTVERVAYATLFGTIASTPLVVWIIRNFLMFDSAVDRTFNLVLPSWHYQIRFLLGGLATWFTPDIFDIQYKAIITLLIGVFAAVLVAMWYRRRRQDLWRDYSRERASILPNILLIYTISYVFFYILSQMTFDSILPFEIRNQVPLFPVALIIGVWVAHRLAVTASPHKALAVVTASFALIVFGQNAIQTGVLAWEYHEQGLGYNSKRWQESPLLAEVQNLPRGILIFTNINNVIDFLTDWQQGVNLFEIPDMGRPGLTGERPEFWSEAESMIRRLRCEGGVIVLQKDHQPHLGDETFWKAHLLLEPIAETTEGSIFRVTGLSSC